MEGTVVVLGGSPRAASRSHLVMEHLGRELVREGASVTLLRPAELNLPEYRPDSAPDSAGLRRLRAAVTACRALVLVSPVYQGSISGAIKNALDHIHDFPESPVGLIGRCATGVAVAEAVGTQPCLAAMRCILRAMGADVLNCFVGLNARDFSEHGASGFGPVAQAQLQALLNSLDAGVRRLTRHTAEEVPAP